MQQATKPTRAKTILKGVAITAASVIALLGVLYVLAIAIVMRSGF